MTIHPEAVINPAAYIEDATIGARTVVRQMASITGGCVIGEDCSVSPFAMLHGSKYGDGTIISGGVKAGPGFLVGSRVFIGPNVVFGNDAWCVADKAGFDTSRFDGTRWAIVVEDGVGIGALSMILPGVRIGRHAMIAAGSVVSRDVPACHLWKGGELIRYTRRPLRMRFAKQVLEDLEAA